MQLPCSIGKYELIEFLGGGMSQVYRGRDTMIDRPVVVKLLTVEACSDADSKARFLQEARVAGNIQHENIVSVFDFGEFEGRPYIVMEYLKGTDLRVALREGVLRDGTSGTLAMRLSIALQIATALEYVHRMEVVHRDIKPENIHLDAAGRAKLMDFGIAKTANLSLTRTGMTMGTPYYMAPEQVSGRPTTPLADIYSYGMLLYELLTGVRGITAGTMEGVFYQILNQPLDEAAMVSAGVPAEIRAIVMQATAKDAAARPQSFTEIIGKLKSFLNSPSAALTQTGEAASPQQHVRPTESPKGPIVRLSLIVYGAVALVTILAVVVWIKVRPALPDDNPVPTKHPAVAKGPAVIHGMVYVEGGSFLAGSDKHPETLKPFYIDEAEVTAGDYCAIIRCEKPPVQADLPIVNVTAAQARNYAMHVGKRLPSGLEWERAARGVNGKLYPWGDAEDPTLANVKDNSSLGTHQLMPVASFRSYPEYQMVGNAWEMVEGAATPSPQAVANFARLLKPPATGTEPWITARGGSYNQPLAPNIVWDSLSIPERFSAPDIGFRCAKDP